MPFSTDIDGQIAQGETKELVLVPEGQDGAFFDPSKVEVTLRFDDSSTTTLDRTDFSLDGEKLVAQVNFPQAGPVGLTVRVEDKDGNVEKITDTADDASVYVSS